MAAQGWNARTTKKLTASGTAASTQLPSLDPETPRKYEIHNTGSVPIAFKIGDASVTATFPDADGEPVGFLQATTTVVILAPPGRDYISVITAGDSADVYITSGNGD